MPEVDVREVVSLQEFEELARAAMSHMAYEYVASGAADEHTLRWNTERYERIRLRPRVLVDVDRLDTAVTLFGKALPFPIMLAPAAYQRAMHADGELGSVRGAGAMGATTIVSTATTTPIAALAKAATAPLWFQLYVQSDRAFTRDLVQEVEAAGCEALVVTVDTPTLGARDRMKRAHFELPPGVPTPHLRDVSEERRGIITPDRVTVTWADIEWLLATATVPVLLKGILDPDDAGARDRRWRTWDRRLEPWRAEPRHRPRDVAHEGCRSGVEHLGAGVPDLASRHGDGRDGQRAGSVEEAVGAGVVVADEEVVARARPCPRS